MEETRESSVAGHTRGEPQGEISSEGKSLPSEPNSKQGRSFDRSIVDGPIRKAVWTIAWPTMLQNLIGGLQGLVDHAMVGHYVGYTGNAAIGVSWQIFLVVVVFISSLFAGMGVLVARFTGAPLNRGYQLQIDGEGGFTETGAVDQRAYLYIPEPATLVLLGLGSLLLFRRRQ